MENVHWKIFVGNFWSVDKFFINRKIDLKNQIWPYEWDITASGEESRFQYKAEGSSKG